MSDDLLCNISAHCAMCPPLPQGERNWARKRVGDPHSPTPRIAVCPIHDIAGPLDLLPDSLRHVVTP